MSDERDKAGQAPAQETESAALPDMTVTVRPIEPRGNLFGFASVKIGPITIDDFKIVEGKEGGLFVGMPSKPDKGSDTGYRPTVWLEKGSKEAFGKIILDKYHQAVEQKQSRAASQHSTPDKEGIDAQMKAAQKQADRNNTARPQKAKKEAARDDGR